MRRKTTRLRILSFILFFVVASVLAAFRDVSNVDEIWNYTFANNIASGLVPYRDFNLLQTPVSCFLGAGGLIIAGKHLLVIRFMGALLFAVICQVLWEGSRLLGGERWFTRILPSVFLMLYSYNVFFEYSCLIMLCLLSSLYIDLYFLENSSAKIYAKPGFQMVIGLLGGMAVMSKQTYGGFVAAASWLAILLIGKWQGREQRERLRLLFFRMLGASIPCFLVLFYLLAMGAWGDFWDMCVRGISTFSTSYSFLQFMRSGTEFLLTGSVFVTLVIAGLGYIVRYRGTKEVRPVILIMLYAGLGCINLYPIANSYHVNTCLIPFLWLAFPLLRKLQRFRVCRGVAVLSLLCMGFYMVAWTPWNMEREGRWTVEIPHLEGVFFPKKDWEAYHNVWKWVGETLNSGREVYILDNRAALYFIPYDRYHKYLDMFLIGNLGTKTEQECLEESLVTGSIYLIPGNERGQYQYPQSAVEKFADTRLQKTGEIEEFTVWKYTATVVNAP